MDRYVETTLWQKDMSKCGICGMSKTKHAAKKNCCKEEHKQVKLEKDHQAAEFVYKQLQELSSIILPTSYAEQIIPVVRNIAKEFPNSHAPPNKEYNSIYILNCTYLI